MIANIGFMQGRLTDLVNNKIQSFPWVNWKNEFKIANEIDFNLMEWTLDHENLSKNPLMTKIGQSQILDLSLKYNVKIKSLTGDCFMQTPFWKSSKNVMGLQNEFLEVANACSELDISIIVVPLVDNGSIENIDQESKLLEFCSNNTEFFKKKNLQIAFETDFEPERVLGLVKNLDYKVFGVNYDIGNSASLGFNPKYEIKIYGQRIINVHIKDRKFNGSTVPLGSGSANFQSVFRNLNYINYKGNFILQAARSKSNEHKQILEKYKSQVLLWMNGDKNVI
jgi:L-ribulose-5-phosphate 3-epimerase